MRRQPSSSYWLALIAGIKLSQRGTRAKNNSRPCTAPRVTAASEGSGGLEMTKFCNHCPSRQTVDRIYRKFNPDYLSDLAESLSKKVFAPTPLALTKPENG